MKLQVFSLGLLAATGVARPLDGDEGLTVYKLRIASGEKSLDGQYLTLSDSKVGVYSVEDGIAVEIYTIQSRNDSSMVELHTYPIGIIDHALGLVGSEQTGLLAFQDLTNPETASVPVGTTQDWTSFRLSDKSATADKPSNTITYAKNEPGGRWVAFPGAKSGSWNVKVGIGRAWTTQDYHPIDIVYEVVTTRGSYGGGTE